MLSTQIKISKLKYFFLTSILCLVAFYSKSQTKNTPFNKFKCLTYLYNITNDGELKIRDICYSVDLEFHNDLNRFRNPISIDRTLDIYKYNIHIVDNEKRRDIKINVGFNKVVEDSEKIQYNCIYDDNEIKALIYFKKENKWGILMLENGEFKYFSFYSGYSFTDYFGVSKTKRSKFSSSF